MKKVAFLLLVAASIMSCERCNKPVQEDLTYEVISDDALYGAGDEEIAKGNYIIRTEAEWNDLVSKMNSVNPESDDFQHLPIDFSQEMVIACFDEVRENSGYDIAITQLEQTGGEIFVTVEESTTDFDSGAMVMMVIQQPYFIIKLNETDLPISFL